MPWSMTITTVFNAPRYGGAISGCLIRKSISYPMHLVFDRQLGDKFRTPYRWGVCDPALKHRPLVVASAFAALRCRGDYTSPRPLRRHAATPLPRPSDSLPPPGFSRIPAVPRSSSNTQDATCNNHTQSCSGVQTVVKKPLNPVAEIPALHTIRVRKKFKVLLLQA